VKSMMELIDELWFLKRDIVSEDYDRALYRLAEEAGGGSMTIHTYPTGEPCWTWTVPERWTCHEAYVETLNGNRLIDYANHPLHVVSYSLTFEGVVSRQELLEHLHVHASLPDAIPFVFKYYQRDWGLCASQTLRDSLNEDFYKVVVRSSFEHGTLKVGEIVVPGESEETFVLVAHLCHPAMANDDLTGVVVGLEVIRALSSMPQLHYTYRFLVLPETIGSVAYLSHNEHLIPHMTGGLFLEMLGNDSPHALQQSFQPGSQVDRCLASAINDLDPGGYIAPYRMVINNDERQFNAPGVRVPMLSLSRVHHRESPTWPYPEYHSSRDNPAIITGERLEQSRQVVLGLIDSLEHNQYVGNNFKGEVFCSGYGMWIDYRVNPEGHRRLFEIMERCDGSYTVADIALELDISFQAVWEVIKMLHEMNLVWFSRLPGSDGNSPLR
jgi:aminopeptidase-like protein